MTCKHQNINFSVEPKDLGSLSFLVVKICNENSKLNTSVCRKPPPFGRVFTSYENFKPRYQKEDFNTHYFIGVSAHVVII